MNATRRRCGMFMAILAPDINVATYYLLSYFFITALRQVILLILLALFFAAGSAILQYFCATLFIYAIMYITRCSAIAERPRCRVRYSFRQK